MKKFGEFVKEKRLENNLTLREFCKKVDFDPSNWSKIERGINPPPKSMEYINKIANALMLKEGSEEFNILKDSAAIDFIPKDLIEDNILEELPIFFRTVRGNELTEQELKDLAERLRRS